MTMDEKLKEIENSTCDHPGEIGRALLSVINRCREQRKENALGWEQFDYEFEANWSEEKDDLELLRLLGEGEGK